MVTLFAWLNSMMCSYSFGLTFSFWDLHECDTRKMLNKTDYKCTTIYTLPIVI